MGSRVVAAAEDPEADYLRSVITGMVEDDPSMASDLRALFEDLSRAAKNHGEGCVVH